MKFGSLTPADAVGHILAHSIALTSGRLRKGTVLNAEHCRLLADAGHETVMVAQLEPGDVVEDDAAAQLAEALVGSQIRAGTAATGRANLYAATDGVFQVNKALVDAINSVDEAITVATLEAHAPVRKGQMIVTIKIIPFAVDRNSLHGALEKAQSARAFSVAPFVAKKPALVMTRLPGFKQSILEKAEKTTRKRLEALGQRLERVAIIEHETAALANQLSELADSGHDPVLIIGASAIVDRRDTIPAAIETAGGHVDHFGMPVDPGNLLALGHLGRVMVVGLPGCARAPQANGFDWVLHRLLADIPVTGADLQAMGVGGLLKEIISRPQPRGGIDQPADAPGRTIAILAAGLSRRMGADNKLLLKYRGKALVRHVAEAALAAEPDQVIVVRGHEADAITAALSGLNVRFVDAPEFASGMGHSIAALMGAIDKDCGRLLMTLGDMPQVTGKTMRTLLDAVDPAEGIVAAVPVYNGKRGNPVAFARPVFGALADLSGDSGARALLRGLGERLRPVDVDDPGVVVDVDTPKALADLSG